jgi:site-specific DNA-methyltransferase (adenine-specific)/modification methylase
MLEINKIYCGDCLELMKQMDTDSVDLTITSPPYNVGNNNMTEAKYGEKSKDQMSEEQYYQFLSKGIDEMVRITKNYVFFNIQMLSFNKKILLQIMGEKRDFIKEVIIWNKKQVAPAIEPGVMNSKFEFILVFSKNNPEKRKFDICYFKQGNFNNVLEGKNAGQNDYANTHKATFPEYLPGVLINNFSKEGEIIFDPFVGTGTTTFSANKNHRAFIGIDISAEYCDIANQRLRQEILL